MISLIEENRAAIAELCRQYGIQKLAVFGSAVNGTWDPDTSDIDFVLEMSDYGPGVTWRYLSFGVALEDLMGRDIDMVTIRSLKTPSFRNEVLKSMEVLIDDGTVVAGTVTPS